jgi:hypothetical protein
MDKTKRQINVKSVLADSDFHTGNAFRLFRIFREASHRWHVTSKTDLRNEPQISRVEGTATDGTDGLLAPTLSERRTANGELSEPQISQIDTAKGFSFSRHTQAHKRTANELGFHSPQWRLRTEPQLTPICADGSGGHAHALKQMVTEALHLFLTTCIVYVVIFEWLGVKILLRMRFWVQRLRYIEN